MKGFVSKLRRHGPLGSVRRGWLIGQRKIGWLNFKFKGVRRYQAPTEQELSQIEAGLEGMGIEVENFSPEVEEFNAFIAKDFFSSDYHGGKAGGVWYEKVLEHWISAKLLGVLEYSGDDIFIDVAAASSPWAHVLRDCCGIQSYAIDLIEATNSYRDLPYYRVEDATATSFSDGSVSGIALHCAYEMFTDDADRKLIEEASRILKPGGKVVILPFYMHTHYCAYSTPEFYGKGLSDPAAEEYLRMDCWGVPSSRKYDVEKLKERVLDPIVNNGMKYRLLALRNKNAFGQGIYCHFILEITR